MGGLRQLGRFRRLRQERRIGRALRRLGRLNGFSSVDGADLLLILGIVDEVCIAVDFQFLL